MKFYLASLVLALLSVSQAYAGSSTATPQAVAKLSASCTISAQNIGFGALSLPLSAQGAGSNMTVLCSANAPYTIGLAYGGVYGQGTQVSYNYVYNSYTNNVDGNGKPYTTYYYNVYDGSGKYLNQYRTTSSSIASAVGCTPTSNGCQIGSAAYAYGIMSGAAKGDKLAYSIAVPGNPGQIWNAGNYSYSGTGTGASQSLSLNATLVPGQSGSSYPTPDFYSDTVTATINF